jgi:hypothetical protein
MRDMILINALKRLTSQYGFNSRFGFVVFIFLLLQHLPGEAQTEGSDSPYRYSVAYFGNNLWNPGLKVGVEYPWKEIANVVKQEVEDNFPKKEWVPAANIGLYLDPGSHAGLFTNAGIGYRRTNAKGSARFASLHPAGIYRSFLTETYRYSEQDGVERVPLPGNFYFAPAFSLGIGKFTNPALQSGWFTQLTLITLVPFNHWIMPLINLEAGIMLGKRGGAR